MGVMRLQKRVLEETEVQEAIDKEWDRKVQSKEEGYGKVVAQLKYAEGQIVEERGRTAAALATVKKRERSIERLKNEHTEELRIRKADRDALVVEIADLQNEVEEEAVKVEPLRQMWEARW